MMRNLQDISIQYVKGVGPARKKLFSNLGIESIEDLFYFFPRHYEDRRQMTPISQIKIGENQTVSGTVMVKGGHRSWFTKKHVFETVIGDDSGRIFCVWFNQPFLENYFKMGGRIVLHGKAEVYKSRIQMVSPEYELISADDESLSVGRIVPIYPLTKGMSQRYLRKVIKAALDNYAQQLRDVMPFYIRQKFQLLDLSKSISSVHFPETFETQTQAYKRIAFEEFFFFQISVIMRRLSMVQKAGIAHRVPKEFIDEYIRGFPFQLTRAQIRVIQEIASDLEKISPMLRLLQGDVGSGKTLVAFFGCAAACKSGFQSAIMAPTEILARQHFQTVKGLFECKSFKNIRIALLVSSMKKEQKEAVYLKCQSGEIDLLIGTHALLEEPLKFKNLSYVVIDEQHKFGVKQRALLSDKGSNPDVLIMTATPIPRTLCLTLYGDLDVSTIDELPPNRGKVQTKLFDQTKAIEVYTFVRKLVEEGRQAFVVYPIIEESQHLDLKAAAVSFKHFEQHEFKGLRLGLVHGQMNKSESQQIMGKFKNKEIDILVATTVVEVGIDVPNASIMVIEHAERFGLAQLHQLRGRIGRGSSAAVCFLIAEPANEDAHSRLKAILATNDGFKIAEADLAIRGPGQFFGRHQHGLNELKIANPATQMDILELARTEALDLTSKDPKLKAPCNQTILEVIRKRYPAYLAMVSAG